MGNAFSGNGNRALQNLNAYTWTYHTGSMSLQNLNTAEWAALKDHYQPATMSLQNLVGDIDLSPNMMTGGTFDMQNGTTGSHNIFLARLI